jgi:predicted metal-binding membrane protein
MSSAYATIRGRMVGDLPLLALGASVTAWVALFLATGSEAGARLYGSSMMPGSTIDSTLEFLGAWEVMVIAMMLPSSLRFLTLFRTATGGVRFRAARRAAVCLGYALVWAGVGCFAIFIGEALHRFGGVGAWLETHSSLLAGGVLVLAGCFQFTTLKRGCLTVCSHPGGFFLRYYRRGVGNALALGVRYGLVCLGCCWALMILLVIVGGGSLYLMVALTAIMFAERALGWGDRFVAIVGLTCIVLGVLIAVSPTVVPAFAQNAERWAAMESQQTSNHRGLPCPHSRGHWLACQRVCGE